jgi:hypothetical protein
MDLSIDRCLSSEWADFLSYFREKKELADLGAFIDSLVSPGGLGNGVEIRGYFRHFLMLTLGKGFLTRDDLDGLKRVLMRFQEVLQSPEKPPLDELIETRLQISKLEKGLLRRLYIWPQNMTQIINVEHFNQSSHLRLRSIDQIVNSLVNE